VNRALTDQSVLPALRDEEASHVRLTKRSAALVATGIAGAMVLSACGGGSNNNSGNGSGSGSGSGSLTYGAADDWPQNLFPYISAGNVTTVQDILGRVLPEAFIVQPDFTVKYDSDLLSAEPANKVDNGVQTTTYKINPKAVWSDGSPINADDFIYTWHVSTSTDQGGCPDNLSPTGLQNIKSITGSDNGKTVTVQYATPYADWQGLFSGSQPLLPAHLMANKDNAAQCATFAKGWTTADGLPNDISGGPWQLKKSNIDDGKQIAVLTPNPKYWAAKPGLSRLIIQDVGSDSSVQVQGLQNGELDVVYPQPQLDLVGQIQKLKPNIISKINFGLSFEHLDFNTTDPLLSDIKVRQAIAMSLDRQTIVDQTVGQFSSDAQVLNNRMYVNNQPQYQDNAPAQYKKPDVAGAKALLEGDGYTLGSDGIYAKGGKKLSFKIDTTQNNPLRQTTIEVMAQQLKPAGIQVAANPNADIFAGPDKPTSMNAGGFQMALFAWVSSPFVSANQSIYQTPPSADNVQQNYSRTGTPQIDALLVKLSTDLDPAKQAADANAADKLLWDQMATLPLYQKPTFIAYRSTAHNIVDNASVQRPLWNSDKWTTQ
jgi:peptide/nickel transport system substrate-binding protein